jgi:hypothetical protein
MKRDRSDDTPTSESARSTASSSALESRFGNVFGAKSPMETTSATVAGKRCSGRVVIWGR